MADLWNTATTHSPAPLRPSETFPSQCHISSPGDDHDEDEYEDEEDDDNEDEDEDDDDNEDDEDDVAAGYVLLMIIG